MYVDLTRDHPPSVVVDWFDLLPASLLAFCICHWQRARGQFPSRQQGGGGSRCRRLAGFDIVLVRMLASRITLTEGKQFGNNPRCLRDDSRRGLWVVQYFERTREGSAPEIASDSTDRSCAATRNGAAVLDRRLTTSCNCGQLREYGLSKY